MLHWISCGLPAGEAAEIPDLTFAAAEADALEEWLGEHGAEDRAVLLIAAGRERDAALVERLARRGAAVYVYLQPPRPERQKAMLQAGAEECYAEAFRRDLFLLRRDKRDRAAQALLRRKLRSLDQLKEEMGLEIDTDGERSSWRSRLTEREAAMARLLAQGFSNKEIGEAVNLAPGTVANRLTRIKETLGLDELDRSELARYFRESP